MLGFFLFDMYDTLRIMWSENKYLTISIFLITFGLIYYFLYDYVLFLIYFFSDPNIFY